MIFFPSSEPPRPPSSAEILAFTEFIKGHHSATVKLPEERLTCTWTQHRLTCTKLTSQGYIEQKWGRMRCYHRVADGSTDKHTFNTVELWYQVPHFPEELYDTLHWVSLKYPAPEGAKVVCRPCPERYIEEEYEDNDPHPEAPLSPSGISYIELAGVMAKQSRSSPSRQQPFSQSNDEEWINVGQNINNINAHVGRDRELGMRRRGEESPKQSASRHNSTGQSEEDGATDQSEEYGEADQSEDYGTTDQSEEKGWTEVRRIEKETPQFKMVKKRSASSPASVGTPNPFSALSSKGHDDKKGRSYESPVDINRIVNMARISAAPIPPQRAVFSPKTPSPLGLYQQQTQPQKKTQEDKAVPQAIKNNTNTNLPAAKKQVVSGTSKPTVSFKEKENMNSHKTKVFHTHGYAPSDADKSTTYQQATKMNVIGKKAEGIRQVVNSDEVARAIIKGEDPFKPKRTPLTEVYVEGIKRNKKGVVRKMMVFYKVAVKHIVDIHWLNAYTIVLTVPKSREGELTEQLKLVPETRVIDAFDPLNITDMKKNPRYIGKSDAELIMEACKLGQERMGRAIESLPANRKGTRAFYEFRKASLEWESKRRQHEASKKIHDAEVLMEMDLAPPPMSPLSIAAIEAEANTQPLQ
jgi:hypothetical protein